MSKYLYVQKAFDHGHEIHCAMQYDSAQETEIPENPKCLTVFSKPEVAWHYLEAEAHKVFEKPQYTILPDFVVDEVKYITSDTMPSRACWLDAK